MIFTITLLLSIFVLGIFFGLFKKETYFDNRDDFKSSAIIRCAVVFVGSIIISSLSPLSSEMINVGNVGLQVNKMGDKRGVSQTTYVTGLVFYNSWWSDIKEFPITQQHIDYEETSIITKGGFQAVIKPSFNWSVNPGNAANMYQSLRQDVDQIRDTWLKNAIIGAVNDIANLYTVDSIFNHRAEFEADIVKECNKRVSKWFTVSQLRTNIVPPAAITNAINEKTKAVQEAQGAIQKKIVAEANAQTQIAKARGDSAEAVIAASGRAEAVRKEQQYLTPMYIEYIKAQRWDGKYPQTMLGGNAGVLLNLKQ